METYVDTRRWSQHSKHHGLALGKKILLEEALAELNNLKSDAETDVQSENTPFPCTTICVPERILQVVEAYDCSHGSAWHDLNDDFSSKVVEPQSDNLTAAEHDQYGLSLNEDHKLVTTKGVPEGGIACTVSAFFDDWGALESFLKLPGNAHYGNRVVQIQNVHRNREPGKVWAVLVGVARFVQHFAGQRPRPNCVLEYDPRKGFNSGSFNVIANNRKKYGTKPVTPLLLDFGVDFDCGAAGAFPASRDSFRGALDIMFQSQKMYLEAHAALNEELAKKEDKQLQLQAEIENGIAAEKKETKAEKAAAEKEALGRRT